MESKKVEGGWLLRLEIGEKLPDALVTFCKEKEIVAATAEGIGALEDIVLGYFDRQQKTYERTELTGAFELLHLFSDVAEYDGKLFAHTHVVVSGPDCVARGGHLFEGTICVTGEIRVWTIEHPIKRRMHEDIGLHLWDLS